MGCSRLTLAGLRVTDCVRQDNRDSYCTSPGSVSRGGEEWLAPRQMLKEAWIGLADIGCVRMTKLRLV